MVESYVLGLATEEDRKEFEQLCAKHPELVEARTNFELLIEKKAMENAEKPPVYSKDKIWSAIQHSPAPNTQNIKTMEPTTSRRSSGARLMAAASIVLLLVAAYFIYDFSEKNKKLRKDNEQLVQKTSRTDSVLNKMLEEQEIMRNPNTIVVNMVGTKPAAPSANIYWDTTSANVFMVVKNMPKLASDKQYQLWSLLDGKPTSLGLFDGGQEKVILRMDKAQKADAFAITIEPRGNTGGPHLEDLQTLGKTKL